MPNARKQPEIPLYWQPSGNGAARGVGCDWSRSPTNLEICIRPLSCSVEGQRFLNTEACRASKIQYSAIKAD